MDRPKGHMLSIKDVRLSTAEVNPVVQLVFEHCLGLRERLVKKEEVLRVIKERLE